MNHKVSHVVWFDAKKVLPPKDGEYIVAIAHNVDDPNPCGYITTLDYYSKAKCFNSCDGENRSLHDRVFAWADKVECFDEIFAAFKGDRRVR